MGAIIIGGLWLKDQGGGPRMSHRRVLLLVEDDDQRAAAIKACIPPDIHCVWARSAGAALGVLRRDRFSGIMLDFDLYRSAVGDPQFTGESVAAGICETQSRHCEIFIHSQNPSGARKAFEVLKQSHVADDRSSPARTGAQEQRASDAQEEPMAKLHRQYSPANRMRFAGGCRRSCTCS